MHRLRNVALLLLTLPVTFALPRAASIHSREPEPMFFKGGTSPERLSSEASATDGPATGGPVTEVTATEASGSEAPFTELLDEIVYLDTPREGLGKQRYAADGTTRLLAGVVALDKDRNYVFLIKHHKHHRGYQLPKGGWESDETMRHAAQREGWEEAGIQTTVVQELGSARRVGRREGSETSESHYVEVQIDKRPDRWPEQGKYHRDWFTYQEAMAEFDKDRRTEMKEVLERSSINKDFVRPKDEGHPEETGEQGDSQAEGGERV